MDIYYISDDITYKYINQIPNKQLFYTVSLYMNSDSSDIKTYQGRIFTKPDGTFEIYLNDILRSLYPGIPPITEYSQINIDTYQASDYIEGFFKVIVDDVNYPTVDPNPSQDYQNIIFQNRLLYYNQKFSPYWIFPTNLTKDIYFFRAEENTPDRDKYAISFQDFSFGVYSSKYLFVGCGVDNNPPEEEFYKVYNFGIGEDKPKIHTVYNNLIPNITKGQQRYIWYSTRPGLNPPEPDDWIKYKKLIHYDDFCNDWFLYYTQRNGTYELLPINGNVIFSEQISKSTIKTYTEKELVYNLSSTTEIKVTPGYLQSTDVLDGLFTSTDITLFNWNYNQSSQMGPYEKSKIYKVILQDSNLTKYNIGNNKSMTNPTLTFRLNQSFKFK